MSKIKIATDSTADIPKSFCEELNTLTIRMRQRCLLEIFGIISQARILKSGKTVAFARTMSKRAVFW